MDNDGKKKKIVYAKKEEVMRIVRENLEKDKSLMEKLDKL